MNKILGYLNKIVKWQFLPQLLLFVALSILTIFVISSIFSSFSSCSQNKKEKESKQRNENISIANQDIKILDNKIESIDNTLDDINSNLKVSIENRKKNESRDSGEFSGNYNELLEKYCNDENRNKDTKCKEKRK